MQAGAQADATATRTLQAASTFVQDVAAAGATTDRIAAFLQAVGGVEALFGVLECRAEGVDSIVRAFRILSDVKHAALSSASPVLLARVLSGVRHPSKAVRSLALEQLSTHASNKPEAVAALPLDTVVAALADAELSVASAASSLLELLAAHDLAVVDTVAEALRATVVEDSYGAVQVRVYDLVSRIASISEVALAALRRNDLLTQLLGTVGGSDVMLQMNALQLLPRVGTTPDGLDLLCSSGIVDDLLGFSGGESDSDATPDFLLGEESLRVLGALAASALRLGIPGDTKCGALPIRYLAVTKRWLTFDGEVAAPAVVALGKFASACPPRSLQLVLSCGDDLVIPWLCLASASSVDLQVLALHSLAAALELGENDGEAAAPASEKLFSALGAATDHIGDPMALLLEYLRRPFDELHVAIWTLLGAVVSHSWGLEVAFAAPGFDVVLLGRNKADRSKVATDARFAVVEAVTRHAKLEVLGAPRIEAIRALLRRGAYSVRANDVELGV